MGFLLLASVPMLLKSFSRRSADNDIAGFLMAISHAYPHDMQSAFSAVLVHAFPLTSVAWKRDLFNVGPRILVTDGSTVA